MNDLEPISHAYLRSDLRQLLQALALVGGRGNGEYCAGFADALAAVAVGLGLPTPSPRPTITIEQPEYTRR